MMTNGILHSKNLRDSRAPVLARSTAAAMAGPGEDGARARG
jgi:hypothetical protein